MSLSFISLSSIPLFIVYLLFPGGLIVKHSLLNSPSLFIVHTSHYSNRVIMNLKSEMIIIGSPTKLYCFMLYTNIENVLEIILRLFYFC